MAFDIVLNGCKPPRSPHRTAVFSCSSVLFFFPPALNASDSVTRYAVIADSQPAAAAAANDFNRAVSTSGSVAAHLSAVTSSVFPFLSPPPPPFSAPAVPLRPILSMQGLVSFTEPQHIKGIPGDVEVTSVSPGYKVFFTVCPQSEQSSFSSFFFSFLANKLEPNWCPGS